MSRIEVTLNAGVPQTVTLTPADAKTNIDTPTTGVNPIIWTVLAVLVVLLILLSLFLFIKKKKEKKDNEEEQDKEFEDLY